jgi:hypothetical protein
VKHCPMRQRIQDSWKLCHDAAIALLLLSMARLMAYR